MNGFSELSVVQKETARQKAQRILETPESTSCNNRSNWVWRYKRRGCHSRGLSVVRNCKAVGTGSRETSRSICRIFWRSKRSSLMSGLSGRKWVREPNVGVSKMFNLNRREIRVREYRRGIKDPNTTQLVTWAHKTHSQVSKTIFGF